MPNDSDAVEKQLKEITGASISQIRAAALGTPLRDAITRQQSNAPAPQSSVAPPPAPQIEVTEQSLHPQPFRNPPTPTQDGTPSGSLDLIVVKDAVLHYATFNANLGAEVE